MIKIPYDNKIYANVEFVNFKKLLKAQLHPFKGRKLKPTKGYLTHYYVPKFKRKGKYILLIEPCLTCNEVFAKLKFDSKEETKIALPFVKRDFRWVMEQLVEEYEKQLNNALDYVYTWKLYEYGEEDKNED